MTFPINKVTEFLIIHYNPAKESLIMCEFFLPPLKEKYFCSLQSHFSNMDSSYTLCIRRQAGFQLNLSVALYLQRKLIDLKNILQKTLDKNAHRKLREENTLCMFFHLHPWTTHIRIGAGFNTVRIILGKLLCKQFKPMLRQSVQVLKQPKESVLETEANWKHCLRKDNSIQILVFQFSIILCSTWVHRENKQTKTWWS